MAEYLPDAVKYSQVVFKAWWLVVSVVLFFSVCGGLIVWYLPDVYQSEARISGPSVHAELPVSLGDHDEQKISDLARDILLTEASLEEVAIKNDMLLDAHTARDRRKVLESLKNGVNLASQHEQGFHRNAQFLIISYRDVDAKRSRRVIRRFIDLFLRGTQPGRADLSRSLAFLDKRIERFGALLSDAETELMRFKTENARYEPDDPDTPVFVSIEIEDQYRKLYRDYTEYLAIYEDFVKRRKRSSFIHIPFEGVHPYSVAEWPTTPQDPIAPNRPMLFALILIASCVLGISAPLARDQLRRS